MEVKESNKLVDWVNNLTMSDTVNMILIIVVVITVIVLVGRTFRNKTSI